jgi:polysaccharide biosynthesis transport protein
LSLRDYLEILWRRKWIVLLATVALPAAVVAYSLQQDPSYRATADVLLSRQDIAAALSGAADPGAAQNADRDTRTQAALARVPAVARAAIDEAGVPISLNSFFEQSSVTSSQNSDLLGFQVEYRTRSGAERLVNAYARAFADYREALDTASLRRARREVRTRLRRLADQGNRDSAVYRSLQDKEEALRVLSALQTSHAVVVRTADGAAKVRPKPVRNGVLALVLGAMVGLGIAFLRNALDTRMRSAREIAGRLRVPLLGRLPKVPRHLRKQNRLVMLAEPGGMEAEAFRVLRTNLELANIDREAKVIMVTSALEGEGKSTTISNLAVAAALAGKRVVLVDLDLRRGDIDELFGVANQPGITGVALGLLSLNNALVTIDVGANGDGRLAPSRLASATGEPGSLRILPGGVLLSDAGDFVISDPVGDILRQLRESADIVLVDAPPFLQAGDALAITGRVDGVVIVTRLNAERPTLDELARTLEQSAALTLGVVVTGDSSEHRFYGDNHTSKPARKRVRQPVT